MLRHCYFTDLSANGENKQLLFCGNPYLETAILADVNIIAMIWARVFWRKHDRPEISVTHEPQVTVTRLTHLSLLGLTERDLRAGVQQSHECF